MRAAFFTPVFALAVYAQSSASSSGDDFPQTSFLTQTNSLGVVTGQPAPATNVGSPASSIPVQAPLDTSQPVVATIPAVGPGVHTIAIGGTANTTRTLVVSANNSTTVVLGNPTPSGSDASGSPTGTEARTTGSGASTSGSSSETGSASGSQSTGAAPTMGAVAGGMLGVGALVAAFL